jgi:Rieske Fe-S protein
LAAASAADGAGAAAVAAGAGAGAATLGASFWPHAASISNAAPTAESVYIDSERCISVLLRTFPLIAQSTPVGKIGRLQS